MAAAIGLATAAVGVAGTIAGGQADSARLKMQATIARMQADEADKVYRQDMMRQISNIKAIRASTGASTQSPSFGAFVDENREIADQNRATAVRGYRLQALQYDADRSMVKRLAGLRAAGAAIGGLGGFF
jgi:hypothetical protein